MTAAPGAPPELRDSIQAAFALESLAADTGESDSDSDAAPEPDSPVAGRIAPQSAESASETRPGLLTAPSRMSVAALAAVLMLMGAVVIGSILTPSIDEMGGGQQREVLSDNLANATAHISDEHNKCVDDKAMLREKCRANTFADADDMLTQTLGGGRLFNLDAVGYSFVGAGICPGHEGETTAAHLIYRRDGGDRHADAMASIFIQPDRGQFVDTLTHRGHAWQIGRPYRVGNNAACSRQVYLVSDDSYVYMIVCCSSSDLDEIVSIVVDQLQTTVRR